jgi:hypothetical protein
MTIKSIFATGLSPRPHYYHVPIDMLNAVTLRTDLKLAFVTLGSDGLVHVLHRWRRYQQEYGKPLGDTR